MYGYVHMVRYLLTVKMTFQISKAMFRNSLRALFSAFTTEKFVPLCTASALSQYPVDINDAIHCRRVCTIVGTVVFEVMYYKCTDHVVTESR